MPDSVQDAGQAASEAYRSRPVQALARLGLAARGVVWLVIGLLTVGLARGTDEQADQGGALRAIDAQPWGATLLVVLVVGLAGYVLWLLLDSTVGHRAEQRRSRWSGRAESLGKAAVYAVLCALTVRFLLVGDADDQTTSLTGMVLQWPGGRPLTALAGLAVVAVGLTMTVRGCTFDHAERLGASRTPAGLHRVAAWAGLLGYAGRGLVVALVGAFLVRAAALTDPSEAKGLDAALQTVSDQPLGQGLLWLAAVAMLAFGVWAFIESACREL